MKHRHLQACMTVQACMLRGDSTIADARCHWAKRRAWERSSRAHLGRRACHTFHHPDTAVCGRDQPRPHTEDFVCLLGVQTMQRTLVALTSENVPHLTSTRSAMSRPWNTCPGGNPAQRCLASVARHRVTQSPIFGLSKDLPRAPRCPGRGIRAPRGILRSAAWRQWPIIKFPKALFFELSKDLPRAPRCPGRGTCAPGGTLRSAAWASVAGRRAPRALRHEASPLCAASRHPACAPHESTHGAAWRQGLASAVTVVPAA